MAVEHKLGFAHFAPMWLGQGDSVWQGWRLWLSLFLKLSLWACDMTFFILMSSFPFVNDFIPLVPIHWCWYVCPPSGCCWVATVGGWCLRCLQQGVEDHSLVGVVVSRGLKKDPGCLILGPVWRHHQRIVVPWLMSGLIRFWPFNNLCWKACHQFCKQFKHPLAAHCH